MRPLNGCFMHVGFGFVATFISWGFRAVQPILFIFLIANKKLMNMTVQKLREGSMEAICIEPKPVVHSRVDPSKTAIYHPAVTPDFQTYPQRLKKEKISLLTRGFEKWFTTCKSPIKVPSPEHFPEKKILEYSIKSNQTRRKKNTSGKTTVETHERGESKTAYYFHVIGPYFRWVAAIYSPTCDEKFCELLGLNRDRDDWKRAGRKEGNGVWRSELSAKKMPGQFVSWGTCWRWCSSCGKSSNNSPLCSSILGVKKKNPFIQGHHWDFSFGK